MAFTWTEKSKERQIDINLINKRVFQLIGELSNSIAELSNSIEERSNWIGYLSNWIIESLFELQRCQIQLESSLNQLQISLYVYD